MINLGFLYFFPVPIPGLLGGKGLKGLKGLGGTAEQALVSLNFFLSFFQFFLIFTTIVILFFLTLKIYKLYFECKFKRLLTLLYRLDTELLLFKFVGKVEAKKKLEIDLSREESVGSLEDGVKKKFFRKRVGNHNYARILDGLDMIKEDKIDIDVQIALVNNWIRLVKSM